ncbi:acyl carrier protein [Streptomyces sp. NPDC093261]|uniref:acyl carrier protein n=1 Tax=Streptomyces sp. NPDC093261 TaxID=3366037 RepID=UPI00380BD859
MTSSAPWLQELSEIPPSERRALLESLVVAEFKRELMMDEADVLPHDQSYFELGLTSLGATDVRQRLEKEIGRPLDSAHLFNHPTVGHLVDFLVAEVIPEFFPSATAAEPAPQAAAEQAGPSTKDLVDDMLKELYR